MSKKKSETQMLHENGVEKSAAEIAEEAFIRVQEAEETARVKPAIEVTKRTMSGDLRDIVLELFKNRKKSWQEMAEHEQQEAIAMIETAIDKAVEEAVTVIAADSRPQIMGTIDGMTIKGGIVVKVKISKHDENRHELFDADGGKVLIILADASDYAGEREPAKAEPDQPELTGLTGDALKAHLDQEDSADEAAEHGED